MIRIMFMDATAKLCLFATGLVLTLAGCRFASTTCQRRADDTRQQAVLHRVGQMLACASGQPSFTWTFEVKDSPVENAYSLPEDRIVIYDGMMKLFENEAELAAVVAHEMWHIIAGHRGKPSPEMEESADAKGLMLMAETGYDPQAAVSFWTRYYERTGWWEGDGTHPKPRERLAHLNALMPKAKELYRVANNKKQKESAK